MAEIILAILCIIFGVLLGLATLVGAFGTAMGRATNPSAPSHDLVFLGMAVVTIGLIGGGIYMLFT